MIPINVAAGLDAANFTATTRSRSHLLSDINRPAAAAFCAGRRLRWIKRSAAGGRQKITQDAEYRRAVCGQGAALYELSHRAALPCRRRCRAEDRLRRAVIERLMCDLAVDLDAIASAHGYGREAFADSLVHLEPHLQDKIALFDRSRLTIAPEWRAATRLVCAAFDSRLDAGLRKHALAV